MTQEEISRLALEIAVDAAWCGIESACLHEADESGEWMSLDPADRDNCADYLRLLDELQLLGKHPSKPGWVREIAEL